MNPNVLVFTRDQNLLLELGTRLEDMPDDDCRERAIAARDQTQRDEELAAALIARWGFTKYVPRHYAERAWTSE